jgi:alkylation response protein AidB-like acyl-CoA dehydrogenase
VTETEVAAAIDAFLADAARNPGQNADIWGRQYDAGLAWVDFPRGLGGLGASRSLRGLVTERLTAAGIVDSASFNGVGVGLAGPLLISHGRLAQQQAHLRPLFTGEHICCQLFSEPGAGSDLAALATLAMRDGDHYVVNGQKVWTTFGHVAKWGLLCARTAPDLPKHQGLSFFLLDMESPGVDVRPIRQITGDAEFNEVFLHDVRVPASAIIGKEGDGWSAIVAVLANERASFSAQPLPRGGGAIKDLDLLWARHGADRPELADRYLRLWVRAEALRLAESAAIRSAELGIPSAAWSYLKLVSSELRQAIYSFALTLKGQAGLEYASYEMRQPAPGENLERTGDVAWAFVFTRCETIAAGTSEIQRDIIADRVLRLPREPQTDRNTPWRELRRS